MRFIVQSGITPISFGFSRPEPSRFFHMYKIKIKFYSWFCVILAIMEFLSHLVACQHPEHVRMFFNLSHMLLHIHQDCPGNFHHLLGSFFYYFFPKFLLLKNRVYKERCKYLLAVNFFGTKKLYILQTA